MDCCEIFLGGNEWLRIVGGGRGFLGRIRLLSLVQW